MYEGEKGLSRDIIKIRNDAPVLEAARLMFHNQISAVLVVDANDSLVGLLSERIFIARSIHHILIFTLNQRRFWTMKNGE